MGPRPLPASMARRGPVGIGRLLPKGAIQGLSVGATLAADACTGTSCGAATDALGAEPASLGDDLHAATTKAKETRPVQRLWHSGDMGTHARVQTFRNLDTAARPSDATAVDLSSR